MKLMRITTLLALSLMTGCVYSDDAINGSQTNQTPEDPCIRLEQLFQEGDISRDNCICRDAYYFYCSNTELQEKMAPFRDLIKDEHIPLATKVSLAKICYKKPRISNKELLEKLDPATFALAVMYDLRKPQDIIFAYGLMNREEHLYAIFDKARAHEISPEQFRAQMESFNKDLNILLKEEMFYENGVSYPDRLLNILLQHEKSRMEVLKERDPETYKAVEDFVRHAKAQGIEIA